MLKKLLFCFLLTLVCFPLMAKQYYRFKNSEGKVVIKDQVNNEMISVGYDILNDKGSLIERVPPGKTLAEEKQEQLDKIDEKQSQRLLQLKIRNDAELLRQFSSIGDIIRNRDAQLLGLEQRIKIQHSKSELLKLQLENLQKQAAINERLGQKVPKLIQSDIDATHLQLQNNKKTSASLEEQKIMTASRFEGDIINYKKLESLRKQLKKTEDANDGTSVVIYDCPDQAICQKAWQLAQVYANDKATGRIEIITNSLILTSNPEKDTDLALSFSKIPGSNNTSQIIFEVSCNNSVQGADLCKSEVVTNLRMGYINYINKQLN